MVRLLLVAALLPAVSSTAQATAPDATRRIHRTAVSPPSAGQILFERIAARDGDCYGSIWTVAADGSEQQHSFIASGKGDCDAAWARDGTLIAFASRREGGIARIFVANADGTAQRQLTNSPYDDFLPDWSPDGSQIIFERFFAPDDYELFVMNSDGSALHRLRGGPGYDGTPKWSPDGTLVLFASDRPKPGRPNCSDCSALYLMHPDGTGLRRITRRTVDSLMPAWSPDGSLIAWARQDALYEMNADSSDAHMLSRIGEAPAWAPDGTWIAFADNGAIVVIAKDGTTILRLTTSENATSPAWRPQPG